MRFFSFLFLLAIAATTTQAAFTREVTQETTDLVSQIGLTIQNTVANVNRDSSIPSQQLQQFFEALAVHVQNYLNIVIAEIQSGLQLAQNFQTQVLNAVQQAAGQLVVGVNPTDVVSFLLQNLHTLIGSPHQKADLLTNLLAGALGLSTDAVESLLGVVSWIANLYLTLKPLIDALNIPVMLQGGIQSLINSDYMQWLIYEVAPAQLPQTAVDALNNFLATYFGPSRAGAISEQNKDLADYLQNMYQSLASGVGEQVASLQGVLQNLIQEAQQQSLEFFQQILQFLQQNFALNSAQLGAVWGFLQSQIQAGQDKLKLLS